MTWSISREIEKIMSGNGAPLTVRTMVAFFKVKSIVDTGHRI